MDDPKSERTLRLQSVKRKQKYKEIIEQGTNAAEESEGHSVVENLNIVGQLLAATNILAEQGSVIDRIGQTTEVLMDIQAVKMACDLMGSTVQQIDNVKFSDEQFALAINKYITDDNGETKWSKLDSLFIDGISTFKYSTPIGDAGIKFEDNESEVATQKQRQARKRAELAVETKPMSLTQHEVGEKDYGTKKLKEILRQVEVLFKQNNRKPIPYYKLIIDPDSMMNTFDNGFQISFLFRDGIVGFVYDSEQMPAISWLHPDQRKKEGGGENKQFIVTLNATIIAEMIRRYNITKPLLNINRALYDDLDISQ